MNSNRKSPVSGDLTARKPNGKDVVSSAEPVKRDGQTGVSIATDVSGDPKKTKPNGKAVVSSTEPIRRTGKTGGSCANAVSGDLIPKKSNGKAVVSSAGTIKHSRGSGVPSAKTDEVLFFKDVKLGPQECELSPVQFPEDRFRFYGYEEFEAVSDLKGDLYCTHVRTCLSIRDFNPKATKMINLDVALIDQRNSKREPIPEEADKVCTICQDKLIGTGGVNSPMHRGVDSP
ncbi:hypothetical protein DY000_02039400 [Brassica cretica]|uniref:Uncharacterized protein n=1 Tax=Brassica cretica TaxID=69181 RepID=A0ABQ7BRE3_BRACR|nr:hypothetical protein DY000_02039400 [Brassica cretica]